MYRPSVIGFVGLLIVLSGRGHAGAADDSFFESRIRPVLASTCFRCHGGERTSAKLRLDARASLLRGGKSGPAIIPGSPEKSLLLRALRYEKNAPHMPPKNPLDARVVDDFASWIRAGAPWPAKAALSASVVRRPWALAPLRHQEPPAALPALHHPIDKFIAAAWRSKGLRPVGQADRRVLIRRATFDLIGLPPTPAEVNAFLSDRSPVAYEKLIERLLASPHYGERWGRQWLDVVRYADTAGETADFPVPDAWRYRNYVITAFNHDKPYDAFLREQIAGDILAARLRAGSSPERYAELVTATGYLSIARRFGFDIVQDQYLTIDDTIDTLGKSVLGLAIGCARCHDHKYDPIPTADYYALYGIFDSTRYPFPGCEKTKSPHDMVSMTPPWSRKTPLSFSPSIPGGHGGRPSNVRRVAGFPSPEPMAYAVAEGRPHSARIQERGDPASLGAEVPRGFLHCLGGQLVQPGAGSGRLELADWLTDPRNPLTPRVMVNRIWQGHFGTGIVSTPNDFGTRGDLPTHPELLDYLAERFIESGWSIKAMHRLIMTSAAYQRAGTYEAQDAAIDPANKLLWRFPRRRLSAEEIRDAVLAVSGDLDPAPGGAHPFPDPKTWNFTQHTPFTAVYDDRRRSVYLMVQRIKRHPFLALFDGADANSSTGARFTTTVPTQALFFMNDPFVHAEALRLADRLVACSERHGRLDRVTQLLYGRPATPREQASLSRFLAGYATELSALAPVERQRQAWAAWLRVMLSSNEFIYVD